MSEPAASIELIATGKGRKRGIVAKLPDGEKCIIGRFDLAEESERVRLVDVLCKRFSALDRDDVREQVEKLAMAEEGASEEVRGAGNRLRSQADQLVQIAQELYEFFPGDEGELYAVRKNGPATALSLSGQRESLRRQLAREFHLRDGRVPRSTSLSDALLVIGGIADQQPRRPVYLRAARVGHGYELDIGDESGKCICLDASGWEVRDRASVHFYRTELTQALPVPERECNLDELWSIVNVTQADRTLVIAWAINAIFADRESPILLSTGPKGAGKSTLARAIISIEDPSAADLRPPPSTPDQWSVTAAGSRVVAIDNVSYIRPWQSDAFCRATTGEAFVARLFFTNKGLSVLRFRRGLILTAIDPGAIRDDLGDRIVHIEAPEISPEQRVQPSEVLRRLASARGRLLGALLDIASKVLAELPNVVIPRLPRIGDYYVVLVAVDRVLGTNGQAAFESQAQRMVDDVLESDLTSTALLEYMRDRTEWWATSKEVMTALWPESRPHGAPREPRSLSAVLRRMAPSLRTVGLLVEPPLPRARPRRWQILWSNGSGEGNSSSDRRTDGEPSSDGPQGGFSARRSDDQPTESPTESDGDRRANDASGNGAAMDFRRSDGPDGDSDNWNEGTGFSDADLVAWAHAEKNRKLDFDEWIAIRVDGGTPETHELRVAAARVIWDRQVASDESNSSSLFADPDERGLDYD